MKISSAGRVAAIVAAVVVALTAPGAPDTAAQVMVEDFPTALLAIVQLAALLTALWVLIVLAGGAARLRIPGVPAAWRAVLFTTVVVTAVATPAHAESTHDLDGLTLPDRPMTAQARVSTEGPSAVTVQPGDTLWGIAADQLSDDASPARIARSVARWHSANRQVVGADPDLILPGQVLTPPTTDPSTPEQDIS